MVSRSMILQCCLCIAWIKKIDVFVILCYQYYFYKGQIMADSKTTVKEMLEHMEEFVNERDWEQYHSPKNLAMGLAIGCNLS